MRAEKGSDARRPRLSRSRPDAARIPHDRAAPGCGADPRAAARGARLVGVWNSFPDELAAATGAGVFVYSRAGYGQSSPAKLPRPLAFMHDEALEVLPRVLDAIGFRRGLLVGHSDGASIATIYAGSVQDHRVRGLVLMAPHFFTEDMGIAEIARAKVAFETGDLRAKLARLHADVDNAFRGWNGPWLDPEFPQVGHHRRARLYPRADADRAGRGRPIRHRAPGRGGAGGMLLPGRGRAAAGRAPRAVSRSPGGDACARSPTSSTGCCATTTKAICADAQRC